MDDILLMLPGPTTVDPRVLAAMSKAVVNHRGAKYGEILTETTELMSKVFQTPNKSYLLPDQVLPQWKPLLQIQ